MDVIKLPASMLRIIQRKFRHIRSKRRMIMLIVVVVFVGFIYTETNLESYREGTHILRKQNKNNRFVYPKPTKSTWNYSGNSIEGANGKVNLDMWKGMCSLSFNSLRQHPFFPSNPDERSYLKVEEELRVVNNEKLVALRTMGYLHPPINGNYTFHLRSYFAAQLWLSKGSPQKAQRIAFVPRNSLKNLVFSLGIPNTLSKSIYLEYGHKYYFEILKVVNDPKVSESALNLHWMLPNAKNFTNITSKHVSNYFDALVPMENLLDENPSASLQISYEEAEVMGQNFPVPRFKTSRYHDDWYKKQMKDIFAIKVGNDSVFDRHNVRGLPYMERRYVTAAFPKCSYNPSYMKIMVYKRYSGLWNTYFPEVFPIDGTENVRWSDNETDHEYRYIPHTFIDEKEVVTVVKTFMDTLEKKFPGENSLISVVNIEKAGVDKQKGDRFFLELVLRRRHDNKIYRLSEFFYRNGNKSEVCILDNLKWNPEVWINVVLTVKNQPFWLHYFIKEMGRIVTETRDHRINFIIVYYGKNSLDIGKEMERHGLMKYTIIPQTGKFYKTSSINMAAKTIKNPNSIVFQMDLHLKIPLDFFDKIRKHTVQGKMAFNPCLLRLTQCGRPAINNFFPSGFWEAFGFGIFSIYKSDWDRFGGMNEVEYKHRFGGEDWEMLDRVVGAGIEVEKLRLPGFYHFYHHKRGMWDIAA